jgi:DNA-binding NtrC family response regulator
MTSTKVAKPQLVAIDDNADSAELIARIAAKCGYDAKPITNARDLGQVLAEWKPHVVTLDLCMPEEDGISLLTVLHDNGFTGALVIISGQDDWFRKSAARLASARGINVTHDLPKPVDLKLLRTALMELQQSG